MRNKLKSRKGATLAELVIVLAVVVIAAGMVVSFSSMMHGAQGISNARHEALQDVRVAEALIESFIENNAGEIKIQEDGAGSKGDVIYIGDTYENRKSFIYLGSDGDGNALIYVIQGEGENSDIKPVISLKSAKSISFVEEKGTNDTLYYCTITYSVADAPHSYTYTFCVNPYAGEGGT